MDARKDSVASRLRQTLQLSDDGISMMHMNLRRRFPHESEDAILARLNDWLRTRPGAESGDGWGRPDPQRFANG
jgi:hypothetical protein